MSETLRRALVALALALPASTQAQTPTAFNLTCSGTLRTQTIEGIREEPYRTVYRIDLARNKYCEEDCRALHDIANVGPTAIQLEESDVDTPRRRSHTSNLINRETGEHRAMGASGLRESIIILNWQGTCERSDFTGFPTFPTRF